MTAWLGRAMQCSGMVTLGLLVKAAQGQGNTSHGAGAALQGKSFAKAWQYIAKQRLG